MNISGILLGKEVRYRFSSAPLQPLRHLPHHQCVALELAGELKRWKFFQTIKLNCFNVYILIKINILITEDNEESRVGTR